MPDEGVQTTTIPTAATTTVTQQTEQQKIVFDEWLAKQDDPVKLAYEEHVTGLKNTLKTVRTERDAFAKELRDAAKKLEKGSPAELALTEMAGKYETAEKRAAFYEGATKPGIDCRNPKAAFALATADNLFDHRGNPDWAALKESYPELFGRVNPPANAGAGTSNPPIATDMNQLIRRAAGRQ